MALQFTIKEVNIETVAKGKAKYQIANVVYDYKGENKTQKIMSFANPQVFKDIQNIQPGQSINVEITKNDAGYNQWAKIIKAEDVASGSAVPSSQVASGKVLGSNYETREERATRQILIVKQSSLSSAVEFLSVGAKAPLDVKKVLEVAQEFVDFVFENPAFDSKEEEPKN